MRTLKFRAWDKKKNKWLVGYNVGNLGGFSLFGEVILLGEWSHVLDTYFLAREGHSSEDLVVMQFTGLTDRNGKEVYEGDLIDYAGLKPLKIEWRNAGFAAPLLPFENSDPIALSQEGFSAFAEVIGNVYENPELIPKLSTSPLAHHRFML